MQDAGRGASVRYDSGRACWPLSGGLRGGAGEGGGEGELMVVVMVMVGVMVVWFCLVGWG